MNESAPHDDAQRALRIEALLFTLGEPLSHTELAAMLETDIASTERAVRLLQEKQKEGGRGIILVDDGREAELRAAPSCAELIEKVRKEAYARDIGKAGLETLAAVLYQGPLARAQIDFIRGVNSAQTLRTLAMRGLVRRVENPENERSFLYEPTTELLSQLGVSSSSELPDYEAIRAKLSHLKQVEENGASGMSASRTDDAIA